MLTGTMNALLPAAPFLLAEVAWPPLGAAGALLPALLTATRGPDSFTSDVQAAMAHTSIKDD
jgi:hypothetical protein